MASGDPLLSLLPQNNEPPAASFATPDTRNNHPVLDFALTEVGVFSFVMPRHYSGGGITIYLHYAMSSAIANDINLETAVEKIGDQSQDMDSDGFAASQNTGDVTVPATSGFVDIANTTHTDGAQMDNLIVGDTARLKVTRAAVVGTDAAGDLELRSIEIKET